MMRARTKAVVWVVLGAMLLTLVGCQEVSRLVSGKKQMLWNGKDFAGWERVSADASVDVDTVWQVRDGVIHCAGVPNGYMRTEKTYSDYHLHVEWRWPAAPTNSGVFLHLSGADQVWPKCIESQLQAGNAGDIVLIGGTGVTVDGVDKADPAGGIVVIDKKAETSEKPAGQWNSYDIHCVGGNITCYVNGVLQNEATDAVPASGHIALQSEGGPIEFRNVTLIPAK